MNRILFAVLIGLTGTGVLLALGIWQVQRLAWKEGVLAQIEARITAEPGDLPQMIDPVEQVYMPILASGAIGEGELFVLVSQKRIGAGYRVIAPFRTEAGRRILLDRGFIPVTARDADRRTGATGITGNLHWPDDRNSSTPENDVDGNIWFARDIQMMAEVLKTEPLLVVLRDAMPPDPTITPLPVDTAAISNDHLQYAITWFSLAAVWIGMTGFYIRRTMRRQEN